MTDKPTDRNSIHQPTGDQSVKDDATASPAGSSDPGRRRALRNLGLAAGAIYIAPALLPLNGTASAQGRPPGPGGGGGSGPPWGRPSKPGTSQPSEPSGPSKPSKPSK